MTPYVRSSRIGSNYSASGTDKRGVNGVGGIGSDCESDEGEEGDYTVYECPGLAPVSGSLAVHIVFSKGVTAK